MYGTESIECTYSMVPQTRLTIDDDPSWKCIFSKYFKSSLGIATKNITATMPERPDPMKTQALLKIDGDKRQQPITNR